MLTLIPDDLRELRAAFRGAGLDMRLVGGCVRDALAGLEPSDIDLCTDATVEWQVGLYDALGVSYRPTGLRHGTMTLILDSGRYEISTLRSDAPSSPALWDTDLRHRDLTINAMMMTFDGDLIDPFGGAQDLRLGRVRFAGRPEQRIQEDPLRILRWLRFHDRFGREGPLDLQSLLAAQDCADLLKTVARERVWAEVRKIITGRRPAYMMFQLYHLGLAEHLDLPERFDETALRRIIPLSSCPITRVVAMVGDRSKVEGVAKKWKWSVAEQTKAAFLAKEAFGHLVRYEWLIAYFGRPKDWVIEVAHLRGQSERVPDIEAYDPGCFPVRGQDLIDLGHEPGPELGDLLDDLKMAWAHENGRLTKESLLAGL